MIESKAYKQEEIEIKPYISKGKTEQIRQWEPKCSAALTLKFYNCTLECFDLRKESFDEAPISNLLNVYSVLEPNDTEKMYTFEISKFGENNRSYNLLGKFYLLKIFFK